MKKAKKEKNVFDYLPKPPPPRIIIEGKGCGFCEICGSTVYRTGFLGLFGDKVCANKHCPSNKT